MIQDGSHSEILYTEQISANRRAVMNPDGLIYERAGATSSDDLNGLL